MFSSLSSGRARDVRRERWCALVLALAVLLGLSLGIIACGGDSESDQSIMVFGTAYAAAESGNPNMDQFGFTTDENVYEKLVTYNALTGEYIPTLAETWDISEDGLIWTFHLRKGVKFQDGTTFDSAAAKFSFDLALEGGLAYHLVMVDSVETPDASTLVVKLKYGYPLLYSLSWTPFIVSPAAVNKLGDQAYQPGGNAGSGPYMLKAVNTTVESTLVRFPDYWGGWEGIHANNPDVAIIRSITEAAVRVQNLEQGVVQLIYPTPDTDIKRLEGTGNFKVWVTPAADQIVSHLNCNLEPTNDLNFRMALYYAMPFQDICDLACSGYATPQSGFIAPPQYGYDKQTTEMGLNKQNMDKAREYLAKTKYPNGGVTVSCVTDNAYAQGMKAMELYKTALAELNITLDVQPLDIGVIFQDAMSDSPTKNMVTISEPGLADGVGTLEMDLQSESVYNFNEWSDPAVDTIISDAYSVMAKDRDKAVDLIIQADKILMEQMPMILICNTKSLPGGSVKLKGFEGFTDGTFMNAHFYDYWFEK
jgi:peptide/nickel transport system substrate-binding protein